MILLPVLKQSEWSAGAHWPHSPSMCVLFSSVLVEHQREWWSCFMQEENNIPQYLNGNWHFLVNTPLSLWSAHLLVPEIKINHLLNKYIIVELTIYLPCDKVFWIQDRTDDVILVKPASVWPHLRAINLKLDTAICIHL